jgi:hypothetical protein
VTAGSALTHPGPKTRAGSTLHSRLPRARCASPTRALLRHHSKLESVRVPSIRPKSGASRPALPPAAMRTTPKTPSAGLSREFPQEPELERLRAQARRPLICGMRNRDSLTPPFRPPRLPSVINARSPARARMAAHGIASPDRSGEDVVHLPPVARETSRSRSSNPAATSRPLFRSRGPPSRPHRAPRTPARSEQSE